MIGSKAPEFDERRNIAATGERFTRLKQLGTRARAEYPGTANEGFELLDLLSTRQRVVRVTPKLLNARRKPAATDVLSLHLRTEDPLPV